MSDRVVVGFFPKKISYIFSNSEEVSVGCEWDFNWSSIDDKFLSKKETVFSSFPVDANDTSMISKAKTWATTPNWKTKVKGVAHLVTIDNDPIKKIRLLSISYRSQGGRAYKALIDNKYYVDFREDVLMDTILKSGILKGGILNGEYVWAKIGSNMKLVRVGSELYKIISEYQSKMDMKPVGKNELEVGGLYQDKKKNKAIFIGYVNTTKYYLEDKKIYFLADNKNVDFKYNNVLIKKSLLFYDISNYDLLSNELKNIKNKEYLFNFKIKKTFNFIEKLDQIKIPTDLVEFLRKESLKEVKNKTLEYTGYLNPKPGYRAVRANDLDFHIRQYSQYLNLYKYGDPAIENFDVKKLLTFS